MAKVCTVKESAKPQCPLLIVSSIDALLNVFSFFPPYTGLSLKQAKNISSGP